MTDRVRKSSQQSCWDDLYWKCSERNKAERQRRQDGVRLIYGCGAQPGGRQAGHRGEGFVHDSEGHSVINVTGVRDGEPNLPRGNVNGQEFTVPVFKGLMRQTTIAQER